MDLKRSFSSENKPERIAEDVVEAFDGLGVMIDVVDEDEANDDDADAA
jgi:hypothetical protein